MSDVLAAHYYSHRVLETIFAEAGAPGDPPVGNCRDKCRLWLKKVSEDPSVDAFAVLGGVLSHFMDYDRPSDGMKDGRTRVDEILRRNGLSYRSGGKIFGAAVGVPSKSLDTIIRARDLHAIQVEFDRAVAAVESDPPAALTAACAILESLCKVHIEDERLPMPEKQTIKPLWSVVQKHLGLDPKAMEDDGLAKILGGLASVIDGIGSWRTHTGSAHGRGRRTYKVEPRHARLAIHAAHTLTTFLIETWDDRRLKKNQPANRRLTGAASAAQLHRHDSEPDIRAIAQPADPYARQRRALRAGRAPRPSGAGLTAAKEKAGRHRGGRGARRGPAGPPRPSRWHAP